jgi:sn-glycerol 3-phosphate transport system permease protein
MLGATAMKTLGHTKKKRRRPLLPYLLILPTVVFVILFTVWPTILAFYQSFFLQRLNVARFREPTFIGIENYVDLFTDPRFLRVLSNTLLYVLGTVPISIVLAFLFALLVNRKLRGIGLARLFLFYPTVLPLVSAATVWMFFFTPDYGLLNSALRLLGYSGPENWTGNPDLALLAVAIVAVWKNAGYYMIFYLAGLQSLPTDVFEAAALDGANWWQQLWRIAFPLYRRLRGGRPGWGQLVATVVAHRFPPPETHDAFHHDHRLYRRVPDRGPRLCADSRWPQPGQHRAAFLSLAGEVRKPGCGPGGDSHRHPGRVTADLYRDELYTLGTQGGDQCLMTCPLPGEGWPASETGW